MQNVPDAMTNLLSQLQSASGKNQLQLVEELASKGETGLEALMSFLLERQSKPIELIDGKIYQALIAADTAQTREFLQAHFPQGVVSLRSERGVDYLPLQRLLATQDFEAADRATIEKLCELAGEVAVQRRWLYFTEVESFPITDLQTINSLWLLHSEGKFGFSVQRELWLGVGKDWDKLWEQIGWKRGNAWTRYPGEFTWNLSAPRGHLPLSNQLRGVRVISAILAHPAWTTEL
ncbi:GUN4 N-terminal ARM-like repeat domain-containing protein [Oculatella sp. LEGE 06141]|uniref:GUN4 N-terminal ARM-like repeat domain-containing protein n=2 Tax=Oculatella sp. LEGE 06141 TaxID=1828648 RepID=UPI0018801B04|nr:GUN4 N-terminal ARM-like repeat domain-containing protein [Oculatella sp. LEGE 06141]